MTREEKQKAIDIIRKEYLCVDRDCDIERNCGKCDLMMPSKEPILEAYKMAIKALEQMPKILETLDFAIDASNGETNYFVGFRNGLRYSKSLIDGKEPQFENCTEQEPTTGHWILSDDGLYRPICDKCGAHPWKGYIPTVEEATEVFKYCPNCGCRMVEPQERSDKE